MESRAAQFFSALMWALAALVTNISANSTAVGNDLMVILPRWISIRRGQYLCAIIATACCPWIIQSTAKTFTSFLSGYAVSSLYCSSPLQRYSFRSFSLSLLLTVDECYQGFHLVSFCQKVKLCNLARKPLLDHVCHLEFSRPRILPNARGLVGTRSLNSERNDD